MHKWLIVRSMAATEQELTTITLQKLLGMPGLGVQEEFEFPDDIETVKLSCLHDSPDAFLDELNALKLRPREMILMFIPRGQGFDVGFVVRCVETEEMFIVFLDHKSPEVNSMGGELLQTKLHQYNKMEELRGRLKDLGRSDLSSVGKAFVEGRYRFIYMTTDAGLQQDVKAQLRALPNVDMMLEEDTRRFAGPCYGVLKALRTGSCGSSTSE